MIREERGSSLLLVLFMIVIFTMLGMLVLSASIGGAVRSETRENDVQSLHLAEKALNEALAYIVGKVNSSTSVTPEELMKIIKEFLADENSINNGKNTPIDSELSTMKEPAGRITDYEILDDTNTIPTDHTDITKFNVMINAEGNVNGVVRKLSQQVSFDTFPDFLKYAMGSQGDVILNGSPEIIGDLYVGGKLQINNNAKYYFNGSDGAEETLFPKIKSNLAGEFGRVYVQGKGFEEIYYCNVSCKSPNNNYIRVYPPIQNSPKTVSELLGVTADRIENRDISKFVAIDVEESFLDKLAESVGEDKQGRDGYNSLFRNGSIASVLERVKNKISITNIIEPLLTSDNARYLDDPNLFNEDLASMNTKLTNLSQTTLYNGNLDMDDKTIDKLRYIKDSNGKETNKTRELDSFGHMKSNWFIVNGDLNIINLDPNKTIELKGNILVTGQVFIKGNVAFDATIMTLQSTPDSNRSSTTTIVDAQLRGLDASQLVLISNGEILITRVDGFKYGRGQYQYETDGKTNPDVLKAYFYTDKKATLYGVGSTFWLRGGFFAKGNLTINAIRGEAFNNTTSLGFSETTDEDKPRFVIDYDKSIFINQNAGLPRVNRVSLVVGKKQLVK